MTRALRTNTDMTSKCSPFQWGFILSRNILKAALLLALIVRVGAGIAGAFVGPLDTPAMMSALAPSRPLAAIASAGKRILAAGQRGHIVYSDDGGKTWLQAKVPVSTDLVAISFPTPSQGWAVGHAGVVLSSTDGGKTWARQLDGLQAAKLAVDQLKAQAQSETTVAALAQAQNLLQDAEHGAAPPFLDVLFESATSGFIVGGFNRIFRTEDGGRTWTPWMNRVANPQELHLYSIRRKGDQVYMSGEQGMVWRLESNTQRFVQVPTPYRGTLFSTVITPAAVLVFGMNGTAFRSIDQGATWSRVEIGSRAGITAGTMLGESVVLVNASGQIWVSKDQGASFSNDSVKSGITSYFAVSDLADGALALAGSQGVRVVKLP